MTKKKQSTAHQFWHLLQLIWRLDPMALPIEFGKSLFTLADPYVDLGFLGLLINTLQSNRQHAPILIIVYLLLRIAIIAGTELLTKLATDAEQNVSFLLDAATTEKLLAIPYASLDDPDMRKQYQAAQEGITYSGGIKSFMKNGINAGFNFIIALLVAGGAVVPAMMTANNNLHGWQALVLSPWFFAVGFVLLLIIVALVSDVTMDKSNAISQRIFSQINDSNRAWTYFSNYFNNYSNGRLVRLYHARPMLNKITGDQLDRDTALTNEGIMGAYRYQSLITLTTDLLLAGIYILIGAKAIWGVLTIGAVVTIVGYIQQFLTASSSLFSQFKFYTNMVQYLQYYVDFLNRPELKDMGTIPVEKRDDDDFVIQFHDVSFKYPGSDEWALRHIDLTLNIGQRLAIVGRNGSGKTTFVKLLTRLYQPTEGVITLNDIDIQKYAANEYQRLLGVVFQDFKLFAYSIGENIATRADYDPQRVQESLHVADAQDWVDHLPKGIQTPLTKALSDDGVEVSGGEAQKIAIARAWYKDAPIMILDEPTAALDPISEYEIYQRFDELVAHKTAIYISHRMSSTRFSQRIVVFDHGQIVQDGNHSSLMTQPGVYRQLFNAQAQYYTEDKIAKERQNANTTFSVS